MKRQERIAEWFRDLFASDLIKLLLSLLIIASVLPFPWAQTYSLAFFVIFAVELFGRFTVLRSDLKQGSLVRIEVLILLLDVVATLSLLPIHLWWEEGRLLRLFRLSRMLLLIGYWGGVVRELWAIISKRERRFQLVSVCAAVAMLTLLSAVLLFHFQGSGLDFDEDGSSDNDSFWDMAWWSFRQVQDPGNLVARADVSVAFFCSLSLTLAGLFIFSFLIGIAISVVEELVEVARKRRLGLRRHSVIGNISPYTSTLLEELTAYYAKSLRSPKVITMGPAPVRYDYMYEGPLRRIRYRQGRPLSRHDLVRVDADRAARVILLGQRDRHQSDSEIVSQILSVRAVNPSCYIYAELFFTDNVQAALEAGGARTVPVLADRLVSMFLAKIVVYPGLLEVYSELLSSKGDEVYTCLYSQGAMADMEPPKGPLPPFGELLARCHRHCDAILLGHLVSDPDEPSGVRHRLSAAARSGEPEPDPGPESLRGFFGVSGSFEAMRRFAEQLPEWAEERSGTAEPAAGELPALGLCPVSAAISKVLICGFRDGLVTFCEQLILAMSQLTLWVLIPEERPLEPVLKAFLELLHDPAVEHRQRVHFEQRGPAELSYELRQAEPRTGSIHIIRGEWSSSQGVVVAEPGVSGFCLADLDAMLFTYAPTEADPDAHSALGLLKLLRLTELRPDLVKRGLRIVCEVQDDEKAAVFQRRYGRSSAACHSLSIVAAEQMRNALLAQAVFVPGLTTIYRELLGDEGGELLKLLCTEVADPEAELTFGQLLSGLYQRDRLITIAVELKDAAGEQRLVVNPSVDDDDYRFRAADLVGIIALGEEASLPIAPNPCPACFACSPRADD